MEIDGSGYTRRAPGVLYPTCEDGTLIGGPLDGTRIDFKTNTVRCVLLPESDAEMAAADEAARAEIEALLSPEALRLVKDAEDAFTRSVLGL